VGAIAGDGTGRVTPMAVSALEPESPTSEARVDERSLTDPDLSTNFPAQLAGIQRAHIDLLVRGVCCLRPGVPGVSDTIRVVSVVGRFLEHGRSYYFHNDDAEEMYLGSADLMPRNLNRRVEVVFPLADPLLRTQVRDGILHVQLADTVKARELRVDGTYQRVRPAHDARPFDSQAWFLAHALDEHESFAHAEKAKE
jgi:polyphosphate kinase